jgi:hypothetical protein
VTRIDACRMNCDKCLAHVEVEFDPPCTDNVRAEAIVMARGQLDGWVIDLSMGARHFLCPKHAPRSS